MNLEKISTTKCDLQPGDIVGTTGARFNPADMALRKRQGGIGEMCRTRVSTHIQIVRRISGPRDSIVQVAEAYPPVVRLTVRHTNDVTFIWRPTYGSLKAAMDFADLHVRKRTRYDFPAIATLEGFGRGQDPKEFYCSEFAAAIMLAGLCPEFNADWKILSTPFAMQIRAHVCGKLIYAKDKPWWRV
jgi:hypothetical protein